MAKKVWLSLHGVWYDVISECDAFILARDVDGVMVYVVKDGTEKVKSEK